MQEPQNHGISHGFEAPVSVEMAKDETCVELRFDKLEKLVRIRGVQVSNRTRENRIL